MAEKKKTSSTNSKSGNTKSKSNNTKKNTSNTRSNTTKKTNNTKNTNKKSSSQKTGKKNNQSIKNYRYVSIAMLAVALLIFLIYVIPAKDATVWFKIRGAVLGIFGWSGLVIPVVTAVYSFKLSQGRNTLSPMLITVYSVVGAVLVSALGFVIFGEPETTVALSVKNEFYMYLNTGSSGWGALGTLIGAALLNIGSSKAPAIAILILVIFVLALVITGTTPSDFVPKDEMTDEEREQLEKRRADRQKLKQIKKDRRMEEKILRENDRLERARTANETARVGGYGYLGRTRDFTDVSDERLKENEKNRQTENENTEKLKESLTEIFSGSIDDDEFDEQSEQIRKIYENTDVAGNKTEIFVDSDGVVIEDNTSAVDEEIDEYTPDTEVIHEDESETLEQIAARAAQEIAAANTIAEKNQEEEKIKKMSGKDVETEQALIANQIEQQQEEKKEYFLPQVTLLRLPVKNPGAASQADLLSTGETLIKALKSFNVEASIADIVPGPSVTRFEVKPAPGVKISKFTGLSDDIALQLAAPAGVRIEAPIPNKSTIGIEIPNRGRTTVTLREIIDSDIYKKDKALLRVALGKDIAGNVITCNLAKMPHLLVAGTTGSGKSVCLNAMIVSLLFNAGPDDIKLLLIDPKQVEFSVYDGLPQLLVPVVSEPRKAAGALAWAVTEMEARYRKLTDNNVRDINSYNKLCETNDELKKMPRIVIFIDELADLMAVAPSDVEISIQRLAQKARAAGMHLVVATQRPSVDVVTGTIKSNIPSRIALSVSSQVDSRTIIDTAGAEKLLGLGDMLFQPLGLNKPIRIQGCFLSDSEIEKVTDFIKAQVTGEYNDEIQQEIEKQALATGSKKTAKGEESAPQAPGSISESDMELLNKAAVLVIESPEKASISAFQRNLQLGFSKAGRLMDLLEQKGVVGPHNGSKPREVLMTSGQWAEIYSLAQTDGE